MKSPDIVALNDNEPPFKPAPFALALQLAALRQDAFRFPFASIGAPSEARAVSDEGNAD